MRIFLSCQQALGPHPVPAYDFWEFYFKNALVESGHEVIQTPGVDWAEGLMPLSAESRTAWLNQTWGRTIEFIEAEHRRRPISLFLSYLFPNQVLPSAVRAIRSTGVPTVNFFCDNVREFTRVPDSFRDFDLHWVPEADARAMYAAAGLPYVYSAMPMWVPPKFRIIPNEEKGGAIFIGSHDVLREDLLQDAARRGLSVEIYGSGWLEGPPKGPVRRQSFGQRVANQVDFFRREGVRGVAMKATYLTRDKHPREWIETSAHLPIVNDSYFNATREATVVIGINRCPTFRRPFSNPIRYSRLRDIEAPMLGACYLTELAPGIEDLYDIGSEIETYRDTSELVEKAKRLEADPAKRLAIRRGGQRRALADHTIEKSLKRLAAKLGISK
jgi:hypothetical protein